MVWPYFVPVNITIRNTAGNSGPSAISSINCPPIVAVELCREHLFFFGCQGVYPCDRRKSVSEYECLFPAIDFPLTINVGGEVSTIANIQVLTQLDALLTTVGKSTLDNE
ncbi:phosphoglycerate mutase family protein [Artemisia annua]|uniref:Phosphoglycerate mutase family protein n=1 Tax=Artemisia annua TaxID=35608 RepID=A0A2U1PH41_ARTAN|nr:phosphoglycerate mutase family protein [Artemisia annua]